MIVEIKNNLYKMSRANANELIDFARRQVKTGVYAVSKGDYIQLRNDFYKSKTKLKEAIRMFKQQGFKVYYNGL